MFSSFSFNVQKEILLSKFTGSEISLLVAINNVVTTNWLLMEVAPLCRKVIMVICCVIAGSTVLGMRTVIIYIRYQDRK